MKQRTSTVTAGQLRRLIRHEVARLTEGSFGLSHAMTMAYNVGLHRAIDELWEGLVAQVGDEAQAAQLLDQVVQKAVATAGAKPAA